MVFPSNEAETIRLYKLIQKRIGWRIVHLQSPFPDAIIESEDGDRLIVEFEHLSRSFRNHGHDPAGCDLIICWRDNWSESPLPVQALEDYAEEEIRLINRLVCWSSRRLEWERKWHKQTKGEKAILEEEIEILQQKVKQQRNVIEAYRMMRCRPTGTITIEGVATFCIKYPREYDLCWYYLQLLDRLPGVEEIQDWIRTADISNNRVETHKILGHFKEV